MSEIKKGSMREVFNAIYTKLRSDKDLVSLLTCSPDELDSGELPTKCCMDESCDGYWETIDNHIKLAQKSSKVEEEAVCRLYIYPGRRRAMHNNYLLAKQEVIIDVLVHDSYSEYMRLHWIIDRINELLALEHTDGSFGKLDFVQGNDYVAPIGYVKYQLVYVYGDGKK